MPKVRQKCGRGVAEVWQKQDPIASDRGRMYGTAAAAAAISCQESILCPQLVRADLAVSTVAAVGKALWQASFY
jgi:hypothetical protein